MIRRLILPALVSIVFFDCTPKKDIYLFSYFINNGQDGLHLAYSEDGYQWTALNDGNPFLKPEAGKDKLMRDPCITQGPDGTFHMVWTVSWNERGIGYASSKDLIHWSDQMFIPVMEHKKLTKNCWAPEIFYDEASEQFMIYWSSTIPGEFPETDSTAEADWNHRIYYTLTKDFQHFSLAKLLLDPGFNVIDATIMKEGDQYVMIVKDETKFPEAQKDLHVLISNSLTQWAGVPISESISDHWVEGPTITKIDDQYVVYFDRYRNHTYGAVASTDLRNWEDISKKISFPDGTRHGTAFKVTKEVLNRLQNPTESEQELLAEIQPAPKPLYRDTIFDGAADPVIIWNRDVRKWYMFYTNRRANLESTNGVDWVHGTKIGIAESSDAKNWKYIGVCNINYGEDDYSHWAPEIVVEGSTYHMYLTVVPGTFSDWSHPRDIVHLTSENLLDWEYQSTLELASDKCIDACVFQMEDGTYRMYYNNERAGKSMFYADSKDLYNWTDSGEKVVDQRGEGPKVFEWKNKYWMITDTWRGLGVFSSDDLINWSMQENKILDRPGKYADDRVIGQHPDVVVNGDRAFIFYFTHPGRTEKNKGVDNYETRRSSIQVAELKYRDGQIVCDRNAPTYVELR